MPLSAYKPNLATVELGKDNSFQVRPLTFPDIAAIMVDHREVLVAIVADYVEAKAAGQVDTMAQMAMKVVRDFPVFVVEIISACMHGEPRTPETDKIVVMLPFPIQMDALLKIGRITTEEFGGLGNLMSDWRKRLAEISEVSPTGQAPSV